MSIAPAPSDFPNSISPSAMCSKKTFSAVSGFSAVIADEKKITRTFFAFHFVIRVSIPL